MQMEEGDEGTGRCERGGVCLATSSTTHSNCSLWTAGSDKQRWRPSVTSLSILSPRHGRTHTAAWRPHLPELEQRSLMLRKKTSFPQIY